MQEQMTNQDAIETLEIFRNDYTREGSAMCRAIDIAIDALRQPTIEPEVRLIPKEVSATDLDKLTEMIKSSLLQAYPDDAMFTAVRHGRWILEREPDGTPYRLHCSECDPDFAVMYNVVATDYCPDCGAKMETDRIFEREVREDG